MVQCSMCGMEVPTGANGRCFLGHVLEGYPVASAPLTQPEVAAAPIVAPPAVAPQPIPQAASVVEAPVVAPEPQPVVSPFLSPAPLAPAASVPAVPASEPEGLRFLQPAALAPPLQSQPPATVASPVPDFAPVQTPAHVVSAPVAPSPVAPSPFAALTPVALGSSALAVEPVAEEAPLPSMSQDLFVVAGKKPSSSGSRRQPRMIALIAVLLLIVAFFGYKAYSSTLGSAAVAPPSTAVKLASAKPARVLVAGQSHSYHLRVATNQTVKGVRGMVVTIGNLDFTEREVSLSAGVATLRYSFERVGVTVNGRSVATPFSGSALTVQMDRAGKLTVVKSEGRIDFLPGFSGKEIAAMLAPVLPRSATRVGTIWSSNGASSLPGMTQPVAATEHFRLEAIKGDQATVHEALSVPIKLRTGAAHLEGRLSSAGTNVVQRSTGRTLSGKGRGQLNLRSWVEGKPGLINSTIAITVDLTESAPRTGASSV